MPAETRSSETRALLDAFQCMWFDPLNWPPIVSAAEYILATFDMEIRVSTIETLQKGWPCFIESKLDQLEWWLDSLNCYLNEADEANDNLDLASEHCTGKFICVLEEDVLPLFRRLKTTLEKMKCAYPCIDELRIPVEEFWLEKNRHKLSPHERAGLLLDNLYAFFLEEIEIEPVHYNYSCESLCDEYKETFDELENLAKMAKFDNNDDLRAWILFTWAATFQRYESTLPFSTTK